MMTGTEEKLDNTISIRMGALMAFLVAFTVALAANSAVLAHDADSQFAVASGNETTCVDMRASFVEYHGEAVEVICGIDDYYASHYYFD